MILASYDGDIVEFLETNVVPWVGVVVVSWVTVLLLRLGIDWELGKTMTLSLEDIEWDSSGVMVEQFSINPSNVRYTVLGCLMMESILWNSEL